MFRRYRHQCEANAHGPACHTRWTHFYQKKPLVLFFTEDSLGVAILGSPAANPFRFMRLTVHPIPVRRHVEDPQQNATMLPCQASDQSGTPADPKFPLILAPTRQGRILCR